jgi:hypothetical protein
MAVLCNGVKTPSTYKVVRAKQEAEISAASLAFENT